MTTTHAPRDITRWYRIVGLLIMAAAIATGLALGSATPANAEPPLTTNQAFNKCMRDPSTLPGSDGYIICCVISGGTVTTNPDGSYKKCATSTSQPAPPRTNSPPRPLPASIPTHIPDKADAT